MDRNRYARKALSFTPYLDLIFAFRHVHKRFPNLVKPLLFSDKILWRMLFDRRSEYAWTCDKLKMKTQALQRCADVAVAEVLWTGEDLSDLTNAQLDGDWVLKHISGTGKVYFGHGMVDLIALESVRKATASWVQSNEYSKNQRYYCCTVLSHSYFDCANDYSNTQINGVHNSSTGSTEKTG